MPSPVVDILNNVCNVVWNISVSNYCLDSREFLSTLFTQYFLSPVHTFTYLSTFSFYFLLLLSHSSSAFCFSLYFLYFANYFLIILSLCTHIFVHSHYTFSPLFSPFSYVLPLLSFSLSAFAPISTSTFSLHFYLLFSLFIFSHHFLNQLLPLLSSLHLSIFCLHVFYFSRYILNRLTRSNFSSISHSSLYILSAFSHLFCSFL